uniref:Uncharacterized protein n=1 Tax=Gallus gallus TaxID=9031 RepID=A0A8V1AIJ3_CHICK
MTEPQEPGRHAWVGTWRPHRPRGHHLGPVPQPRAPVLHPGDNRYSHHPQGVRRPGTYTLPRLMGPNTVYTSASPCYSVRGRSQRGRFDEDLAKVTLIKPQAPASTFGIRHSLYATPLIVE